jgi:hypothetical protein
VIVRIGDRQVAWAVDRMEGELELVVKDLGSYLRRVPGISGATIAGDGSVMLLLDLRDIAERTIGGVRQQVATVPTLGAPKAKRAASSSSRTRSAYASWSGSSCRGRIRGRDGDRRPGRRCQAARPGGRPGRE